MKKFRRTIAFGSAVAALASVSLVGSAASGPVASAEDTWFYDPDRLVFESLPGTDTETLWGDIDGAAWRFEIPADWNGSLLMWAHGYRGEGLELYVDNPPIREHLIDQGYAWAASSYERNGYAVRQGVDNTKELADHVIDELLPAEPDLVLLSGASMGGHITGVAIEEHHQLYDGAMPICGVMGDYELFDYFLDFNVAAQQMALGESQFPVDPTTWFSTTVPEIKAELEGVPGGWPFVLSDTGEKFKNLVEKQSGGERPNFDEAWAFWNGFPTATGFGNFLFDQGAGTGVLPNSDGLVVLDNTTTRYDLNFNSDQTPEERELNNGIVRVQKDRFSRANERITGLLRDRVMSLHNLGDLFVTFEMQVDYARDVAAQGRSNRLVQRAIRGSGHCDFTDYELTTAFDDLVSWVTTGVRPAGDEVLRSGARSAEDYGCQFSDPDHTLHQFATPCD